MLNIVSALAFTEGKPFRESMFKNWIFIGWSLVCFLYLCLTLFAQYTNEIPFMKPINNIVIGYSMVIFS